MLRSTRAPFLRRIHTPDSPGDGYPFDIPVIASGIDITFTTPVTFFVGENGCGKSTLLEALAECCGFNPEGGNRDHHREVFEDRSPLAQAPTTYHETKHYQITRDFLNSPERFYKHLLAPTPAEETE